MRSALIALLVAGCGLAAAPPRTTESAPPPKAVETSPPKVAEAPRKEAPSPPPTKAAPAKAAAKPVTPAKAPLDLKTLEQRLRETSAIGALTKLSLKNQVDDLVARFRSFHEGQRPPTLPQLRPSYELLLMKVLSLLQDKDAALAKDIDASRDAIWGVLTDREKLAQFL